VTVEVGLAEVLSGVTAGVCEGCVESAAQPLPSKTRIIRTILKMRIFIMTKSQKYNRR
jgi:hypothetical protein